MFRVYDKVYCYREVVCSRNLPLDDLLHYLSGGGQDDFFKLEQDENDPNKVIIWSEFNLKKPLTPSDFENYDKLWAYVDRYHQYSRKRFAELPAIRITMKNYEELEKQWEGIRKNKPKYLIFREHDNGYVDILEKEELSAEDVKIMNREHKIYQNYIKRWNEYKKAHPEKLYPIWRSPADNLFESDFALYDPIDEVGVDDEDKKTVSIWQRIKNMINRIKNIFG